MSHHFSGFVCALVGVSLLGAASAQCTSAWLPGEGVPGTDGAVLAAAAWDADGVGPEPSRLVIGGRFRIAGEVSAAGVAVTE